MVSQKRAGSKLTGLLGLGLALTFIIAATYKFAVKQDLSVAKFVAVLALSGSLLIGSAFAFGHSSAAGRRGARDSTMKEAVAIAAFCFLLFVAALCFAIRGEGVSPASIGVMLVASVYGSCGAVKLLLRVRAQHRQARSSEPESADPGNGGPERE